ncbi:response regulator [Gorillibacterium sp. sgz5001074]|uniref:response regulator n=1 Tax=Gorillibacterium sp. sgz5001074 TaxID=3446695 RepID=UPI003F660E93
MIFHFLSLRQKLIMGFGIIVVLLIGVLGYTYINYDKQVAAVSDNLNTHDVIRESDAILVSLLNMETGARGYAIAGKEEFLEPYYQGLSDFDLHYDRILSLLSDRPAQLTKLEALREGYKRWFDWETNVLIASRRSAVLGLGNMDDVIVTVRTDQGKKEMDHLRSILADINHEEEIVLQSRNAKMSSAEARTGMVMSFGGLLAVLLAIIISFITSYSVSKPLRTVITAIERITVENYQEPIRLRTDKALAVLIGHFNRMQAAIQWREHELKRKNEALKIRMAEVDEANRLKSQFLATMSHELRTPLNSIIGFTGRVLKKSQDVLPDVQKENLEIVKEEAQHLLELINSLLDYSKMEAGKMEIHLESLNLLKVLEEVQSMTKTLMEAKNMSFVLASYNLVQVHVVTDRMKLKQILINLISNAFKYSEKGTVQVRIKRKFGFLVIDVIDEGIGIEPENLDNIFDEFRQVDGSYTRKVGGTGLGLSITRKLVHILGGRISVSSRPGIGSRFRVVMHAVRDLETELSTERLQKSHGSAKKRIVCVDDDQNVQKLYRQTLEEHGYEILSLDGRENVVRAIEEFKPEVVILDIMLPYKDGWELLTEIKKHPQTYHIPVIMASVLSESNLAYRMKADDYLIKPMSQEELIGAISRILSNREGIEVLLADDDENFLYLMGQFLKEEEISYRLARDGLEVLDQMISHKPDIVILDLIMPKLDGFGVIEAIRSDKRIRDTPVVVVTSKDLTQIEKAFLAERSGIVIQKSGALIDQVMQMLVKRIKEKSYEPQNTDRGGPSS